MMLNARRKPLIAAVLLLTLSGVTISCVDNSYDLKKDIDMTINVGGQHLGIPVGYTEKIMLDKIIKLEEGDDLQLVNGEYHLLKKGTVDNATTDVKGVTVKGQENSIDKITAANEHSIPDAEGVIETIIEQTGHINASAENIDEAVKEIGTIDAADKTDLSLKLMLEGDLNFESVSAELKVTFPAFLQFEDDGNLAGNVLTLKLENNELKIGTPYIYPLKLKGYKFGSVAGEGRKITDQQLTINETVKITGTATVKINGNITAGTSLEISPIVTLADMTVAKITGIIQPTIAETGSTINIESLPDFLQDGATELDITNPIFTFIAKNPLAAPVVLNGKMEGLKDGSPIAGSTVIIGKNSTDGQEIILQPGDNVIALSRLGSGGEANSTNIKVSDINNLIKRIPDAVSVTLEPTVEYAKYYSVNLGTTYTMDSSYDIDIPLSFGSGLKIVYEETLDNFDLDLEDIDLKKAIISLTADNIIPLKMEIKEENVSALDKEGNKIEGIKVTVEGTITEGKGNGTAVSSQLKINLDTTKEGAITQLDGLAFKITAVPGQSTNVQLRSDQWMQLKNMKLKIPNGIKVDLN